MVKSSHSANIYPFFKIDLFGWCDPSKFCCFFSPWKLHTGFNFFFYFIRTHLASARNWRCPSLKVEKKGEEATAKEGRERGERKGGRERGVTRSACRRDQQRSTRSQSTHWCRDPKAATLFWNCAHFSVKSVLNTRNIWGRTGREPALPATARLSSFSLFPARMGESAASLKF